MSLRLRILIVAMLGLALVSSACPVFAQNPNRVNQGQNPNRLNPQFGRRNKPPVRPMPNDAHMGQARPKLNPAQRQQLQQRLMRAIGLSPEQHDRIQQIRRDHEEERISAGRRLREARRNLDRAIMNENYNESAVRKATDELAAAQSDKIKLESRIRSEIRGVLTPDQVNRFHQLERELRREMREQNEQQQRERDGDELDLLEISNKN
ncbi:MAG TPA: periplasmic heavy metal sensor [Blastocatellia bacterium]|nr:periplasmic heavy metal sensor [Blastocatellia bacterium]